MFNFLKRDKAPKPPVDEQTRLWLEESMAYLLDLFASEQILTKKVLVPHHTDFPIRYDGSEESGAATLKIVARQMNIDPSKVQLDYFDDGVRSLSTGSPLYGGKIYLETEKDKGTAGLYFDTTSESIHLIAIERRKLTQPENLVATIAHELGHAKLLGEKQLDQNDEKLTDLSTVVFGLGIFNANAAFQTYRTIDSHGWRKMGYLTQMEWGYALALYAKARKETNPDWLTYLTKNVQVDFTNSKRFLEQ